ncbi:hypothetical protein VSS37_08235 [Candidatus Thiothrix sp. Deng01]|uniref:Cytochrome c domain-containing protein n=1 Tax=Candidatus Thiothrix phosphatis TaxID=3112415 RepID=A0ABU6CWL3_9GAMM|nr:hypothetical protein [Candidatus Thiothrix sp. Deng01]MEB4590961.1 hypothetical protein [Candidatus Thiothrix sp. Deng01]
MKRLALLALAMGMVAGSLVGCGETKTDTAVAPVAQEQKTAPNAPPQATANSELSGQAIHDANCISCHDSGVYTRADHKMQDYAMLSAQVRRCDANLGARLFDEDLDKVTDYLNDTYYHFAKP